MGKGILETLKADTHEAAYRVAGVQIMKATKTGILNVLQKRGLDNKYIESVSDFIDTELGTALLSTCVGFIFSYIPPFKNDKRAKVLAKEFRVGGMALAGNLLADKAIVDLLPKLNKILEVLPKAQTKQTGEKLRIPELEETVYEELEEHKASGKCKKYELDTWN